MILVRIEYYSTGNKDDGSTFELFETMEKAFDFQNSLKEEDIAFIDLVDINPNNIYYEDGNLNYEDNSELFL